jgi:hypothetical protein
VILVVVFLCCGEDFLCTGDLFSCFSQLGDGTNVDRYTPVVVVSSGVAMVAVGGVRLSMICHRPVVCSRALVMYFIRCVVTSCCGDLSLCDMDCNGL